MGVIMKRAIAEIATLAMIFLSLILAWVLLGG
jgi:hypothetical protein